MDLGCPDDALIKAETIEKLTVGNFFIFQKSGTFSNLCFVRFFDKRSNSKGALFKSAEAPMKFADFRRNAW